MKITKIHIENFRALLNVSIDIEEKLSIIVGKNNTGKTSIKVLLDKFLSGDSAMFSLNDLNCKLQEILVRQIDFDLMKTEAAILDNGVGEFAIKLFLHISYDKNDDLSNLPITDLDMNRTEIIVGFAYRLKAENYLKLLAVYKEKKARLEQIKIDKPSLNVPNVMHLLKDEGIGNFFDSVIYISESNDDELIQYKAPIADDAKEQKIITRADIQRIINYKYISAERESLNPNSSKGKTATLSVLAAKYWAISTVAQENEEIMKSKHELEAQFLLADEDFTKIYGHVFQQTLDEITALSDSKDKLKIESSFQARNLLSENAMVMYEHDFTKLPEYYNGLGYMNLIEIIFKLTLIKRQFEEYAEGYGADINVLFIEEPEAHMHPQMQVIFIKNIEKLLKLGNCKSVQTLLSTHSSHIAANTDMEAFKYFINIEGSGVKVKNLRELKPKEIPTITETSTDAEIAEAAKKELDFATYRFVKQYITLNRAEVFFADKIIIIEGDTERILLPSIMKKIDDEQVESKNYSPLLSQNISIIEAGAYAKEFDGLIKFLGIKTLIITDVDYIDDDGKKIDEKNAKGTSNSTIKFYFKQKTMNATKYIDEIKTATEKERTTNDNILIAYQQKEVEYWARSFEDAFIAINHEWLKGVSDMMFERGAIQNKATLMEGTDFYTMANNCIKSKTAFAVSAIFESQRKETTIGWMTPKYIREGLLWLSK